MASLFKKKTVDDIIKEQNRELRGTQRAISRDRAALEKQEKQLELEIKKMAKTGNKEACKVLAKQLVQLRKQKNRTYAVSSKVTSMSTQTKVMNSQMKMAGAMSATAKTMQAVNKKMDPQKTLQTMQNFQKENMKMEMTEEMINDTLDDIFDASDEEEESQDIVNQVLDEIGIEISGKMAKAPSAARGLPSASASSTATISDEEIERQLKALGNESLKGHKVLSHLDRMDFSLHAFLKLSCKFSKRQIVVWLNSEPCTAASASPTGVHVHGLLHGLALPAEFLLEVGGSGIVREEGLGHGSEAMAQGTGAGTERVLREFVQARDEMLFAVPQNMGSDGETKQSSKHIYYLHCYASNIRMISPCREHIIRNRSKGHTDCKACQDISEDPHRRNEHFSEGPHILKEEKALGKVAVTPPSPQPLENRQTLPQPTRVGSASSTTEQRKNL
ncbi:hypothetical protein IHE44_0005940, partial [Lamprotornis superbus]